MTFTEAIAAIGAGDKLSRDAWRSDGQDMVSIYRNPADGAALLRRDHTGMVEPYTLTSGDMAATDWIWWEAPEPGEEMNIYADRAARK